MIHITVVAVGRLKTSPLLSMIQRYTSLLHWKFQIKEIDSKEELKTSFPEKFLSLIPKGSFLIALDEKGEDLSSPEFSQHVHNLQNHGKSHLCFIIGGADGLPTLLKEKSQKTISFGRATWPHMLVRLLLVEQLYRAQQILRGHPYHRE
jgi:23S rRNA (pseudouridine1915-N3)-methyltransferase